MMQMLKIAFRNILKNYQRTLLLSGILALGFTIITLANSIATSLEHTAIRNAINAKGGHVFVIGRELTASGKELRVISEMDKLEKTLAPFESMIAKRIIRNEQFVEFIVGSNIQYTDITGIDFSNETEAIDYIDLLEGDWDNILTNEDSLVLSQDVVTKLNARLGESITVKAKTLTGQVNIMNFTLRGITHIPNRALRNLFTAGYAHLSKINTLTGLQKGQCTNYNIYLNNMEDAWHIIKEIRLNLRTRYTHKEFLRDANLESYPSDKEVKELMSRYDFSQMQNVVQFFWEGTAFTAFSIDIRLGTIKKVTQSIRTMALGIFIIILGITMIGIINTYQMIMLERQAEIGIMRAMGAQKSSIRSIFVWEALLISLAGLLMGFIMTLLMMSLLHFIEFPQNNYFAYYLKQGHLHFSLSWQTISVNAAVICLVSVNAVARPAKAAAQLEPAQALNR